MVELKDVANGVFKSFCFALIIGSVSCHQGLTTIGGPRGIGRSVTKAVVNSRTIRLAPPILEQPSGIARPRLAATSGVLKLSGPGTADGDCSFSVNEHLVGISLAQVLHFFGDEPV